MRIAALTSVVFVAFISATNAQKLSLTPQVGFENSRTSINFNNLGSFAPLGGEFNPQLSLRLDYKFKQGFGPYLAASTSRSVVLYSFSDIENGMNLYNATNGDMQLRMEAGYQFTTNPILFNKTKKSSGISFSQKTTVTKNYNSNYSYRGNCARKFSSSSRSSCCSKNNQSRKMQDKNKGGWVRLQPSLGVGFIPSPKTDVVTKMQGSQTVYEYRAGNWNTALVTGMGFEFGRNKQRLFNISVNYFSGIGNLDKQTVAFASGTKTTVANLESKASGWNVRVGIPFTLAEKRAPMKHKLNSRSNQREGCCDKIKAEYKLRCRSL